MPSTARQILKTILSLTILGFIAIQVDLSQTITLIQSLNLVYLAGVLALGVFGIFVSTQKWSLLLTQAGTPIPFGQLLRLFSSADRIAAGDPWAKLAAPVRDLLTRMAG